MAVGILLAAEFGGTGKISPKNLAIGAVAFAALTTAGTIGKTHESLNPTMEKVLHNKININK